MIRSRVFVLLAFVAVVGGVLGLVRSASASNYAFAVRSMEMQVEVRTDASARIRYEITFDNDRFASPIDIVDIGLPHDGYDRGALRAWIDGHELKGIRASTYIDIGVEVPLHGRAIAPGQSGTFTFETVVPDMVYSDTTNPEQASLRITPTWFDGSLVRGTTDLKIGVWLPKGVDAGRVLHHGIHGDADYRIAEYDGQILVGWHHPNTRLTRAHMVGVSFPREVMTRVIEITRLELLLRWWEGSPEVRAGAFIVLLFGMGFAFFRFSGGTGASVFVFVTVGVVVLYWLRPRVQFYTTPIWLVLGLWMERKTRRVRGSYLPPIISVEGGGIKRGLTAPAAAVLLELPLGRVLTLVIFGMLKKGLLEAIENRPLRIRVPEDLAPSNRGQRRKAAAARGVVIHKYEHAFIDAVGTHTGLSPDLIDFADAMKGLVEHVAERVTGYDLPETRKYYAQLVERAWTAASAIGELEHRTQAVDRDLEWLIMDERYTDRFDGWDRTGYRYQPIWIRSAPVSVDGAGARGPSPGGSAVPAPTVGDVGASFAGWSENVANGFMSSLSPATVRGSSGVINLGGADKVTVDVLSALFSGDGSSGGGGGGGGCACACAGCACACACAGGGR